MTNKEFSIIASLDISASSKNIEQQLIQQVLPNVNSKNPLKIVASLNLNQTSTIIQNQLNSITSGLNFNIGNVGSQISNQLSSVAPSANSANQSIANFRNTLMQLDSLLKTPIAIKYDNSGQMNLQSTLENVKSTFAQFGKVTFNWFKDDNGSVNRFVANIKNANGEVQKLKYQLDGTNFKYIGGSGEDSGIYKLAQGIDNARVKYSGLLADFKSSKGQLTSGLTTQITNVQNAINGLGQTTSIDNVKNAFRSLQTEASKISANLNSTNSSFNKVNNAIQSLADMPNKIKNLEIALGNLKKPPVEISNELTKLKTLFTEITAIEQQQGTSVAWSEKYKEVSATVKSLESNIKTISNAEKANNSEIQKANEYYRQMKENVTLIQTLQNRRTTANTSETAEIDRQIKNAQNRIKYEEQQIQKKNLYNEALQREVNTLRNVQSEHNKLTVAQAKDNATQTLTNLEQKWQRQGVLVGNVKTQVETLKAQISGIKDLNGLNAFNSQLGTLQGQVSQNLNVGNVNSQLAVLSNKLSTAQSKFQAFTGSMKSNAVSQFRGEIASVNSQFEKVKTAMAQGNVAGAKRYFQEATSQATKFRTEMVSAGNVGISMFDRLIKNVKQFSNYLLSATTVMLPLRLIRGVIDNVKELDKALVDIQMATGGTYEETAKLVQSYSELGQKIGATTKEIADSSNEWLRQGVAIEDANTLIYDSMVLSKVGMISSADATSYLTAIRKSYNTSVEDTIGIVDKLTAVDMQAAVSAGGIAEGLARVSNIAQISGISLEKLIGYLTITGEVTQKEMSEIGNSFQAIFSRMGNIKAGKFVDDETSENLNDVSKVLNKIGINLFDQQGQFRNFGTVLDEVANKWETYDSVEKNAIATAMAGVRNRENLLVLFNNYNKALEYTSIAANSAGTAQEKMANYEESIEARTKRLTAAFEEFSSKALNSDSFKSLIDTGTGFVSVINKIIDTLGGIPTLLSAIAATMVFAKTDRTKCCPYEYVRNNLTVTLNEFMLEMVA